MSLATFALHTIFMTLDVHRISVWIEQNYFFTSVLLFLSNLFRDTLSKVKFSLLYQKRLFARYGAATYFFWPLDNTYHPAVDCCYMLYDTHRARDLGRSGEHISPLETESSLLHGSPSYVKCCWHPCESNKK